MTYETPRQKNATEKIYDMRVEARKKKEYEMENESKKEKPELTIEPTFVPRGSGNNPYGGKQDLKYKIKEWGYIFSTEKDALKYAKTHVETTNEDGVKGVIIEKKNTKLRRYE